MSVLLPAGCPSRREENDPATGCRGWFSDRLADFRRLRAR
jgi:hypothetical protein